MTTRIFTIFAFLFFSAFAYAGEPGPEPASVAPKDSYKVTADFLLWNATEDGLGWVATCPGGAGTIVMGCDVRQMQPDWRGGFRIGAGYQWSEDMWDVFGKWTWFQDSDYDQVTTVSSLFPIWLHPDVNNNIGRDSGSSWFKVKFNAFDFELAKTFKPGSFFTLRPYVGLKGATIYQTMNNNFVGGAVTNDNLNDSAYMSSDFGGLGFRGGFDYNWDLNWYGFSLFAKGAFSILFGKFKVDHLTRSAALAQPTLTIAHVSDEFMTTKGVFEGALGINMHTTDLLGEEYPLDFYAMWEDQEWFKQNQFMLFMSDLTDDGKFIHDKGDLGLNGVTFGLALGFSI
ncbi:MAG TPA: Lpg1974 family pore-forming outer membrane protein [Bdellovibrionota bacterium]|nr:Lpg1974 family pore-forming outer membrane protein [Bdellovibrionota bacterium]